MKTLIRALTLLLIMVFGGGMYSMEHVQTAASPLRVLSSEEISKLVETFKKDSSSRGMHKEIEEDFPEFEAELPEWRQTFPRYEVAGNLDYFMSMDDLKNAVVAKFKTMYARGDILTQEQFEKLNKDEWFPKGEKLTRIWGAEYLASKFKEHAMPMYKVPDYIIVVKDLKDIKVEVVMGPCFPILSIE